MLVFSGAVPVFCAALCAPLSAHLAYEAAMICTRAQEKGQSLLDASPTRTREDSPFFAHVSSQTSGRMETAPVFSLSGSGYGGLGWRTDNMTKSRLCPLHLSVPFALFSVMVYQPASPQASEGIGGGQTQASGVRRCHVPTGILKGPGRRNRIRFAHSDKR